MKEAEWEHQKDLQFMKNIATNNLTKPQQKVKQLTDLFQAEPYNMDYAKAQIQANEIVAMYGSSETAALVKNAHNEAYRLNEANNPGSPVTYIYDQLGWNILLDKNLGTENMVKLPISIKEIKKTVDGKTKKVKEERFDFENIPGKIIRPGLFYFIDTGIDAGAIYQYTGEGAIRNWTDVISSINEGTWKVYAQ
tara:strand:- start:97 stop:678 length:582 start_codon:yes stop_codon:yes gene_type:complete